MSNRRMPQDLIRGAQRLLQSAWDEVLTIPAAELETASPFVEERLSKDIECIMNGHTKALKYALLTQTLAKATDPQLNCLALQAGAAIKGAFDARSLCKKVVVPFEQGNFSNALGGSSDPYVSKPLRRPEITREDKVIREIKYPEEWEALYRVLSAIETAPKPQELATRVLRQILLEVRRQISQLSVSLPTSISTEELRNILREYLSQPTLGMGPQAVTYALLKVFNKRTGAFYEVTSASPTTADAPAGRLADIECKDSNGNIRLAVYVTQRLDLSKLEYELRKCKEKGVTNVLFVAHEIAVELEKAYSETTRYDINVAINRLVDLVLSITVLLNSEMRRELIDEICRVLSKWGGSSAERGFNEVLRQVLQMTYQG